MMRRAQGVLGKAIVTFALGSAVALMVVASGCSSDPQPEVTLGSPVETVERLLELRAARSVDASAYAEVVAEQEVALNLVASAQAEGDSDIAPTPEWEQPYVSSREETSSGVVVVWKADSDHADWPLATVFTVADVDGEWLATDAIPVYAKADVPPPLD